MKFIGHRVADRRMLHLIQKWLKEEGSEDGPTSKACLTALIGVRVQNARLRIQRSSRGFGLDRHERPLRLLSPGQAALNQPDPVIQATVGPRVATTSGLSFAGVGNGDYGFTPNAAPPDTNGTVGATQYVQWVNESFAVFDKSTGALVSGPAAGNTLWQGLASPCATNNDGDPIAQYDKINNRWVLTVFGDE